MYSTSTSAGVSLAVVSAPDFTLAAGAKSYSGKAGGQIVVPMTMVPINGTLNHVVQFAVTGLPNGATAVFSPATLTLGGDSISVSVTIQLAANTAQTRPASKVYAVAACMLFASFLVLRRKGVMPLLAVVLCVSLAGCGSGFRAGVTQDTLTGATAQTSIAVVTATTTGVLGGALSHSTSVALVVSK